ncbi:hypothetical protein [Rivularia sp. UHCC 0363]|uniref:hypothetical protein n=1 Tax=Rivularia sp. UHCC 0363 TaxID=3110244 RepID=UPI002B204D09|nr:hypothetical protein [Rivularia sp. UHCC 0363]MEA5595123.1 hypothetical protein [Rivularia sp. UHCC 0363]
MTFPQLQEFLIKAQPMKMYLDIGDQLSQKSPIAIQQSNSNTLVLPVVFSHMSFLLIQALCETGHGEFRISSEKKNHELAVYLGSHISYRYLLNPQQVEPIKNAYHQVTNTWSKWHFSK